MGAPAPKEQGKDEDAVRRANAFDPKTGATGEKRWAAPASNTPSVTGGRRDPDYQHAMAVWQNLDQLARKKGIPRSRLNVLIPTLATVSLAPIDGDKKSPRGLIVVGTGEGWFLGERRRPPKGATEAFEYELYEYVGRPYRLDEQKVGIWQRASDWGLEPLRNGRYYVHVGRQSWLNKGLFLDVTDLLLPDDGTPIHLAMDIRDQWNFYILDGYYQFPKRKPWSPFYTQSSYDEEGAETEYFIRDPMRYVTLRNGVRTALSGVVVLPGAEIPYSKNLWTAGTKRFEGYWLVKPRHPRCAPIHLPDFSKLSLAETQADREDRTTPPAAKEGAEGR